MFLQELELQQFRCFSEKKINFAAPVTLITGDNGVGKTSIIEAIYYLSYFKSFRSHIMSDLMHAGSNSFFLKGLFNLETLAEGHAIQVGYSAHKKSIKKNKKSVTSYKEVLSMFRVVTLTEDDIDLIKGYPSNRRAFIDQAVVLAYPESVELYKKFKQILHQRNAFLEQSMHYFNASEFDIWTQNLAEITAKIQILRQSVMVQIEKMVNELINQFFDGIYKISLIYEPKVVIFDEKQDIVRFFIDRLQNQERMIKRSLFGSHLDDLIIQLNGQKAQIFASRGQQKLISLLCKLSLILIQRDNQEKPLLLIDDFISDFDQIRIKNLINFLISCQNQIIITAPFFDTVLKDLLHKADPDVISLKS